MGKVSFVKDIGHNKQTRVEIVSFDGNGLQT